MIRAVFFDVGGTLFHVWPSVGEGYARVGRQFGYTASAEAMERAFHTAWEQMKTVASGQLSTSDRNWWLPLVERAVAWQGLEYRRRYFETLYEAFTEPASWQVFPDAAEVPTECR